MVAKGPQAFRTISEVAEELDLPQHVLRFWETRFSQIRPMKRGGGRRYYRPDDVDLLRGIRALLYGEGYTIRGVQRILKEQGPRFVVGAGRGDMSDAFQPAPAADDDGEDLELDTFADLDDDSDGADEAEADAEVGSAADEPIEPTFDPREFRPDAGGGSAAAPKHSAPRGPALASDDLRRLQGTLGDLLELKRLLDASRD
jgi:DNA-binding transcriptional MerR regulator